MFGTESPPTEIDLDFDTGVNVTQKVSQEKEFEVCDSRHEPINLAIGNTMIQARN